MLLRLSSKRQLAIPRSICESLRLKKTATNSRRVSWTEELFWNLYKKIINQLHGKYAGANMLKELEEEHKQGIENG